MKKQLQQDERGVAHVLLILVVVVVLAVVGFAGWRVYKNDKDKKSSTTTSTTSTKAKASVARTACMTKYNDKDLCAFQAAMVTTPLEKTPFQATLTVKQDGVTSTMTFAQDSKGNSKLTTTSGETQLNTVLLNGVTYVETNGVWIKYPATTDVPTSTNPTEDLSFAASFDSTKFAKVGTEACGSLTCTKYKIADNLMAGSTQYAWIDNKDHLLREWSATDANSSTDMKISYQAVSITMPSPVQDYSTQ